MFGANSIEKGYLNFEVVSKAQAVPNVSPVSRARAGAFVSQKACTITGRGDQGTLLANQCWGWCGKSFVGRGGACTVTIGSLKVARGGV